jgi:hypothetical protein
VRGQRERREDYLKGGEEEHREDSAQRDEQDGRSTLGGKRGQGKGCEHGHAARPTVPHGFCAQAEEHCRERGQQQCQQREQEERGPRGNCGGHTHACKKATRKQHLRIRAGTGNSLKFTRMPTSGRTPSRSATFSAQASSSK